jgi:hypothetical protein
VCQPLAASTFKNLEGLRVERLQLSLKALLRSFLAGHRCRVVGAHARFSDRRGPSANPLSERCSGRRTAAPKTAASNATTRTPSALSWLIGSPLCPALPLSSCDAPPPGLGTRPVLRPTWFGQRPFSSAGARSRSRRGELRAHGEQPLCGLGQKHAAVDGWS